MISIFYIKAQNPFTGDLMKVLRIIGLALMLSTVAWGQLLRGGNMPVARVGNTDISQGRVDSLTQLLAMEQFQGQNVPAHVMEQVKFTVVENLVGQELLRLESEARKIAVSNGLVDSMVTMAKAQFPDEKTFIERLAMTGSNLAEFRDRIRNQLKTEILLEQEFPPAADPTEKEIRDFFARNREKFPVNDSVNGAQIFISVDKKDDSATIDNKRVMLEGLRAQVLSGRASFPMLAAHYSDDPQARQTGGVIGKFVPKDFGTEWIEVVKNLQVTEMSRVFRSAQGFHLVMLTEKNDGRLESYVPKIDYLLRMEQEQRRQEKVRAFLESLAKKYKVTYNNPAYKAPMAIGG
jgi:parvulin-like peptidyl-prolyl isomerase